MANIKQALEQIKTDPRGVIDSAIAATVCRELGLEWRHTPLTPPNTLALLLQQVLHGNVSNAELLDIAGLDLTEAAYCTAKGRLPLKVMREFSRRVCQAAASAAGQSGADPWRGHRVWHEDGSTFSMPDALEIREHFGLPAGQEAGCGFPTAHILCLFSANTGMLREVVVSPLRTHDLSHAGEIVAHLSAGDIQIGDTAFSSYFHLAALAARKALAIFPVHQRRLVDFRPHRPFSAWRSKKRVKGQPTSQWIKCLGKHDQIVRYFKPESCPKWLSEAEYDRAPAFLEVREIRRKIYRYGRPLVVTISTTLLDPVKYPADEIVKLLEKRWNVEVNLRHLKTTMGLDMLRCQSVDGVQKELWAFVLIYNLVRVIMLEASVRQKVKVERISFASALYWMRHAKADREMPVLRVNPQRPDRVEPRAVKRRPKAYLLLNKPRDVMRKTLRGRRPARKRSGLI